MLLNCQEVIDHCPSNQPLRLKIKKGPKLIFCILDYPLLEQSLKKILSIWTIPILLNSFCKCEHVDS